MSARVVAIGAVSALGSGREAYSIGAPGAAPRVRVGLDPALERAGLSRPRAARAAVREHSAVDPAEALLSKAIDQCLAALTPALRAARVGLAVGTSSGGMASAERLFAALDAGTAISRDLARRATYFGPVEAVVAKTRQAFAPRALVLGACASSTLAVGLALRWLALGRCDVALAGGFDALSLFVASGFEALRATTASLPRPFRAGRDGMALGEGAAILALVGCEAGAARGAPAKVEGAMPSAVFVSGFGASTDAVHLTAPDPTGDGVARAGLRALADAGVPACAVDLVSAHATATPFNDPAEARAIRRVLGEAEPRAVHPFKAEIGHTLGAAGALESLAALDGLSRGVLPAAAGEGAVDPECVLPLLEANRALPDARAAIKLSSAFGGANAVLVLTRRPAARPSMRPLPVFTDGWVALPRGLAPRALEEALAGRHPHLHRLDPLSRLALSAVHLLFAERGGKVPGEGAGIIVGHSLATLEQNELFDCRRRTRGPAAVEPRLFPATSPNAAAGECAITFHLTGPSFAVGGSLHGGLEALDVACDLVAAGDAPAMVVVAADLGGPVTTALLDAAGGPSMVEGAAACLLTSAPVHGARALERPIPLTLGGEPDWIRSAPFGHAELVQHLAGVGVPPLGRGGRGSSGCAAGPLDPTEGTVGAPRG